VYRKHRILIATMLSTGFLVGTAAQADPLDFSLNLGGPGYSVGFSNYPQYYYLAPPQPYVSWYSPPLYAQYELWYYYPQVYYEYYPAPPPPPPPGAPPPPPPGQPGGPGGPPPGGPGGPP
jgi:hypothetical protein